ncbi:agmatine deiminase family protein [uncultured Endozoicomonas sp.]|uniref:agmatine deiminase family protein n=1 Tax=uncultured Endozoicomonas sp. TaxID=432652 RepID=UPI00262BFB9E|nr:agmatine deiminase family protein [uncultured Endozoicomonas sp.]
MDVKRKETTSFISQNTIDQNNSTLKSDVESGGRSKNQAKSSASRFAHWIVDNTGKALMYGAFLSIAIGGLAGGISYLARENSVKNTNSAPSLSNRQITKVPSDEVYKSRPSHTTTSLPPSLDETTAELISKSISEAPDFLTAMPMEKSEWYTALTTQAADTQNTTVDERVTVTPQKMRYETYKLPDWCLGSETRTVDLTPVYGRSPYAEYNKAWYVIFNDETDYESGIIKQKIAEELPSDVNLLVYSSSNSTEFVKKYETYVDKERLHTLKIAPANVTFWARDSLPIPVKEEDGSLLLVDAQYRRFQQDQRFADFFNTSILSYPLYYEGGNFMADEHGNCITVNACNTQYIPDSLFSRFYGCKRLTRLKYLSGIGHVDEVAKFIDAENIVTDQPGYKQTFEDLRYKVTMLPQPAHDYETYVNALRVDNKIFVPVYGQETDAEAIRVYQSFGLEVFPLRSNGLSNNYLGSIHCFTMKYPPVNLA